MRHDRLPGRLVLALHKDPGTAMPHALMTPAADEVLWWFRDEEAEALAAPFRKLPEGVERGYVLNPRASCPEGWEAQHTSGLWVPGDGKLPALLDALTVVRPVQSPDTERVPWWEAHGRTIADGIDAGRTVRRSGNNEGWAWVNTSRVNDSRSDCPDYPDDDGNVTVLAVPS